MLVPIDRKVRLRLFKREPQTAATRLLGCASGSPASRLEQGHSIPRGDTDTHDRRLTFVRRTAITAWALVVVYRTLTVGLAFNRELLLLYIATGLIAACIGRRHKVFTVVRDWLPFALVLLLYDLSRGATALFGASTLWQFQPNADRWLFFGTMPTVWLQERIKMPQPPWWEVIISSIYMSFFILPYVVAGLLWLRSRGDWAAFIRRFVALSFAALVVYVVLPAAPPWAAPLHRSRRGRWSAQSALHVQNARRCPQRWAAGPHANKPTRCAPICGAHLHARLGNAASAVGRSTGQLRAGRRESGRGNSVSTRRIDGDDRGVPLAPRQEMLASAAGGLRVGDGLRAGVCGRALRGRHLAGLGTRSDRPASDGSS